MPLNIHQKQNNQEKLLLSMQIFQRRSGGGERNIEYNKFVLLQYMGHKVKSKYNYF